MYKSLDYYTTVFPFDYSKPPVPSQQFRDLSQSRASSLMMRGRQAGSEQGNLLFLKC